VADLWLRRNILTGFTEYVKVVQNAEINTKMELEVNNQRM